MERKPLTTPRPPELSRRCLLAAATAAAWTPGKVWAEVAKQRSSPLPDLQMRLLTFVADIVLPRSDTPSASEIGVPAFVVAALQHGLEGTRAPAGSAVASVPPRHTRDQLQGLELIDWLESNLSPNLAAPFVNAAGDEQVRRLAALDAAGYGSAIVTPWRSLKSLILTGYYTSKDGASRELQYELVPGRYDPDVALKSGDRAWSSNWTSVTYG